MSKASAIITRALASIAARFASPVSEIAQMAIMAGYTSFGEGLRLRYARVCEGFQPSRDNIGAYTLETAFRGFLPLCGDEGEQLECLATWTPTVALSACGETLLKVKADNSARAERIRKALQVACRYSEPSNLLANCNKMLQYVDAEFTYAADRATVEQ